MASAKSQNPLCWNHETLWWHFRRSKPSTQCPAPRHQRWNAALWVYNVYRPASFPAQLGTWEVRRKKTLDCVFTPARPQEAFGRSAAPEGHLDVSMCRNICEHGRITDAVDALTLLVQHGCQVHNNLFYRVLKRCTNLIQGRRIHDLTLKCGYGGDAFLATHLIAMYAAHGRLEESLQVFRKVSRPSAHNWAAIIFACAKRGDATQAIRLYRRMRETAVQPDNRVFVAVSKACATAGDLIAGREVHAHTLACTGKPDIFVQTGLIDMYAKCKSLKDARRIFDSLPDKNVVTWNAMLAGYAQQGRVQEALSLYDAMQEDGTTQPDCFTFACLLKACATVGLGALQQGMQFHEKIVEQGHQNNVVLGGSLINMYAKCGSLEAARRVFDRLPGRNAVIWATMIASYAQKGMGQEALSLYTSMRHEGLSPPNSATFVCLLQVCAGVGVGALQKGKDLHTQIEKIGLQDEEVIGCSLVNMYAKCGSVEEARVVFDKLPSKDVVTWTAMIAAYTHQGMGKDALTLYSSMQQEGLPPPDSVTFICLLQACASVGAESLPQAKRLHGQIRERGLQDHVVIGGSLVNMYAKCGSLEDARSVFDKLPHRNVVTWTAMITGYVQQGMGHEALSLYGGMQQDGLCPPDSVTFICLLQACASVGEGALREGEQLHAQIVELGKQHDVALGGSLVNMYAKCGSVEDARSVFDRLPQKDVVSWNAMFAGYVQQGMGQEALALYSCMQREGLCSSDSVTFICALQACAIVVGLPLGKRLHAQIEDRGMQDDAVVGAALVNMYAKCGSMFDAQQVFDSLPERTSGAWGALIGGYSREGDSEVVFDLFRRMRLDGLQPDGITFLSLLAVCSHVGLVDNGRMYFDAMGTTYGISPMAEHYICMVDLLGRAGHLEEALQIAKAMPFQVDAAVWHTLLGACHKWNNVEIGSEAFDFAVSFDRKDASSYVLMANIYARAQMWDEAKEMQAKRVKCGACKQPGQSWWTDSAGVVHTFGVGDKKHPESESIYTRLEQLVPNMKKEGYVPQLHSSLRDIPDNEKEAELCGHSEKLAIAYALNNTPEGGTIRVAKNLRVCEDCHIAIAYISKLEKRTIICRDASRFHVYREGKCSCGDYW